MLIGVSYFLKFAFENNWIGPAGRIAIGLIAGIALSYGVRVFVPRIQSVFLLAESRGNRHPVPLAMGCLSGLQPDPQRGRVRHDAGVTAATRRWRSPRMLRSLPPSRLHGGFTTPISCLPDITENWLCFRTWLSSISQPGTGNNQAVAPLARDELRWHPSALFRLVCDSSTPQSTNAHYRLCHALLRHFRRRSAAHVAPEGGKRPSLPRSQPSWRS